MSDVVRPPHDPEAEALYNVRAAIPHHPEILARWARESAAVRRDFAAQGRLHEAFATGRSEAETLDLFLPAGPAPAAGWPVTVFLHGGYWQSLGRQDFSVLAPAFADNGVAVAVVDYALCPAVRLDEIVAQVRQAVRSLHDAARALALDPDRVQVTGHSAGGHLVAMLLADEPHNDVGALIQSAVAISGLFDLRPLVGTSINAKVGLTAETAVQLSPAAHTPAARQPFLVTAGENESAGFHGQIDTLVAAWDSAGTWPIQRIALPGRDHLTAVEALWEPSHPLFRAALDLLKCERPIL